MDFQLSDDEVAFADSARALFADHCSDDALRAHDTGSAPFMQALWSACVATGLHAIVLEESDGGLGQGITALMAVLEQQGRALAGVPLAEHQLALAALARFAPSAASAAQRARLAAGDALATLSFDGLVAAQGLALRARWVDGALQLEGVARTVPLAAQSALALLPVSLDGQARLLALDPQADRVRLVPGRNQRHLSVADLHAEGLRLPADALLAPEAQHWLEPRALAALASLQLGVSAAQLARTVDYVSQRKQFGRVVGSFQLVAGQMADAQIAVEALRSALAQLVYRIDAGLGALPQALSVKVLAAQAAHLVGHKAQHVHGGMGVDITYPIHRYLYWSRSLASQHGGAEPALERLGDWLASDDRLGWKYDLPEDLGTPSGDRHAV